MGGAAFRRHAGQLREEPGVVPLVAIGRGLVAAVTGGEAAGGAAQGVGAEGDRHHAAVDLDPLDQVDRHVGQSEGVAGELEGDPVEEEADLVAAEAVEGEAGARAQAALAPHGDPLGAGEDLAEIGGLLARR